MGLQPEDFRYTLKYEGNEYRLVFAPTGWETDTKVSFGRDSENFGVVQTYSLPLKFIKDGAEILKEAFDKYSFEAEVLMKIEQLNRSKWTYEPFVEYVDVDFSNYLYDGTTVSVTIMQGGATKNIKANANLTYEYPLAGNDVVNIQLPGIKFSDNVDFIFLPTDTSDLNVAKKYTVGFDLLTQDSSGYVEGFNVPQRNAADTDDFNGSDVFLRGRRAGGELLKIKEILKGDILKVPIALDRILYLQIRSTFGNAVVYNLIIRDTAALSVGLTPFDFDFEFNYTLREGEGLYVYHRTDVSLSANYMIINEGELHASHDSVSDPSLCKGIRAYDLFSRIISRISPGTKAVSYRLQDYWKNLFFTSGDAIREITGAKIKMSWDDFLQTFRSIDDIGFGIEGNNAVLELTKDFARFIEIFDIGEVKSCEISVAKEYVFNSIKIGYEDGNTDSRNGREEYNSAQVYALPVTKIIKEKNYVSKTRADQFGIEQLRVSYNVKKTGSTSDTSSDNDSFLLYCEFDGINWVPVKGSSYDSVTGLSSPESAYNLELTPKKNLLRHAPTLSSMLNKLSGRYINFASGTKNTDLVTVLNGIRVKESDNVQVSSLGNGYYQPLIAEINGLLPKNALRKIMAMPYGYLSFSYRGVSYKGFLLDVEVDVARNSNQDLSLLLCSN